MVISPLQSYLYTYIFINRSSILYLGVLRYSSITLSS